VAAIRLCVCRDPENFPPGKRGRMQRPSATAFGGAANSAAVYARPGGNACRSINGPGRHPRHAQGSTPAVMAIRQLACDAGTQNRGARRGGGGQWNPWPRGQTSVQVRCDPHWYSGSRHEKNAGYRHVWVGLDRGAPWIWGGSSRPWNVKDIERARAWRIPTCSTDETGGTFLSRSVLPGARTSCM